MLGEHGAHLYVLSHGIDDRNVEVDDGDGITTYGWANNKKKIKH